MATGIFGVRGLGVYDWLRSQPAGPNDGSECSGPAPQLRGCTLDDDENKSAHDNIPARVIACCQQAASADACFKISQLELPCKRVQLSLQSPDGSLHQMLCNAFVGPCTTEDSLEEHARQIAGQCIEGLHALVLCYGGRKTGKSCTLAGPAGNVDEGQPNASKGGFVQHVVSDVFAHFQTREEVFTIEASCLGICLSNTGQEQLVDLLSSANQSLRVVREPMNPRSFTCEGLSRLPVRWYQRSQELLTTALLRSRAIAHDKGAAHVIFTLHLENLAILPGHKEPITRRGKLVFVYFAGTEGLACLGMPSSGRRWSSSVELLLQDCMDGGCNTLLLAHFRPELAAAQESLATLRGAQVMMHAQGAACQNGTDLHLLPALADAQHCPVHDALRECDKESSTPRMSSGQLALRTPGKGATNGSMHSAGLVDALRRPPQENKQTRMCQLEAQLLEAVAHGRALELESACIESELIDATEHANDLLEGNAELSREIACINQERRSLKRQTDMQHEKLTLFQTELEGYTVQADHLQVTVSQSGNARASDMEGIQQMRTHFVSREGSLLHEVAVKQRAIQDIKQGTKLSVAESTTKWEQTHTQLQSHAQRLQEQAVRETSHLRDAQHGVRVLQLELQNSEIREQGLRQESERKHLIWRRQLESTKARQQELLNMLHELEKGLLHTVDGEIDLGDVLPPTP